MRPEEQEAGVRDRDRIPTIVVGDIHADFDTYRALLRSEEAKHPGQRLSSIQVGDYGIGRFSESEARNVRRFHLTHRRHCFIRGNHDDPDDVFAAPGSIPDGAVLGRILFLGGAESTQRGLPSLGDTEMTREEMDEVLQSLRRSPETPEVIVSHDAPQSVAERLWRETGGQVPAGSSEEPSGQRLSTTRTRLFLDEVYRVVQPALWLFGHWHHPWAYQDGPTHFRCVGYHEAFTLPLPWRSERT